MFINKTVVFFLFISSIAFSQTKKKADTIFVHEKVFVYKKKVDIGERNRQILRSENLKPILFQPLITADTLPFPHIGTLSKNNPKKGKIYTIDNYGILIQSLFSQQSDLKSYGGGIGVFATKNIYRNTVFLNLGFSYSKVFSTVSKRSIDGYYITPEAVLFYQPKDIITQQLNVPITFSWKYKKIKPQAGIAFTQKKTKLDLFAYKNNTDLITVQETSYEVTTNYLDFIYGIEYDLTKRISLQLTSKQTITEIKDNSVSEKLKPLEKLHFFPNQIIFGVIYNFKKQ